MASPDKPSVASTEDRRSRFPDSDIMNSLQFVLRGLLLLATIYTLYFASSLLIPIAFAVLLNVALSPLVTKASRLRIPKALSAALIITSMVGLGVAALLFFAEPAEEWLSKAPKSIREFKTEMVEAKGRLADIQQLASEVEELASVDDSDGAAPAVTIQGPGFLEHFLDDLPVVFVGIGIVMILTFFLLAAGDDFLRRASRLTTTWRDRRRIVTITREIQSEVSTYLSTVTVINVALGLIVALLLYVMGVENPLLWGAMVGLLNFAPYIGALASTFILLVVGLTEFDSLSKGLMVPGIFLVLTILEGQLISPTVLGKRLRLGPVTVFASVIFWGWIWGVAGALLAVPILTSLRVACLHIPKLQPVGILLFGKDGGLEPKVIRDEGTEPAKSSASV